MPRERDNFMKDSEIISLINKGDLDAIDENIKTENLDITKALIVAVHLNNSSVVTHLLDQKNPLIQKNILEKALIKAVERGHADMVSLLLTHSISPNTTDEGGDNLIRIALNNHHEKIVELLLNQGADPNQGAPLLFAVQSGLTSSVLVLLEHHANPNVTNKGNSTPLALALETDNLQMIEPLLENGANVNTCDFYGERPIDIARDSGIATSVELLEKYKKNTKMPKMDPDLERFFQACNLVKKAGHVLGMSTTIEVRKPNSQDMTNIKTELNVTASSISFLHEFLQEYTSNLQNDTTAYRHFKEISDAFQLEHAMLLYNGTTTTEQLFKRYSGTETERPRVITIPTGWSGHDTALALYSNKLVYCNRGMGKGDTEGGTLVHELNPEVQSKITAELIMNLIPRGKKRPSMKEMMDKINVLRTDTTPTVLPSKNQKYGTCTFVNAKSSIEGILYILRKEELITELKKKREQMLPDVIIESSIEVTDEISADLAAKKYARKQYKKFTDEIRNIEIHKLIKLANENNETAELAFAILEKYLIQHHGQSKHELTHNRMDKMQSEFLKALLILNELTPELRRKMIIHLEERGIELLKIAILQNAPTAVALLLNNGANPNFLGVINDTPLIYASFFGYSDIVKMLLDHGANPYIPDNNGCTAESIARQHVRSSILELFKKTNQIRQPADTQLPLLFNKAERAQEKTNIPEPNSPKPKTSPRKKNP